MKPNSIWRLVYEMCPDISLTPKSREPDKTFQSLHINRYTGGKMKERKQYTKEFKEGAARLVTEQGRTVADAAKSLGVSPWTMSRWVRTAKSEGGEAFRGHGQRAPLEQENFELRQQVKQLEEERAILKKAAAYFARDIR